MNRNLELGQNSCLDHWCLLLFDWHWSVGKTFVLSSFSWGSRMSCEVSHKTIRKVIWRLGYLWSHVLHAETQKEFPRWPSLTGDLMALYPPVLWARSFRHLIKYSVLLALTGYIPTLPTFPQSHLKWGIFVNDLGTRIPGGSSNNKILYFNLPETTWIPKNILRAIFMMRFT